MDGAGFSCASRIATAYVYACGITSRPSTLHPGLSTTKDPGGSVMASRILELWDGSRQCWGWWAFHALRAGLFVCLSESASGEGQRAAARRPSDTSGAAGGPLHPFRPPSRGGRRMTRLLSPRWAGVCLAARPPTLRPPFRGQGGWRPATPSPARCHSLAAGHGGKKRSR